MNYLDIFIACTLVFGFSRGYLKGLIMELSSIIALLLGVYGSIKFSDFTFTFFSTRFPKIIENVDENYLKIASFAFTFFLIIILIALIGKAVTRILKMVFLGFLNKILGGFFGMIKFALILSICFVFFENINSTLFLVDDSFAESSFFYNKIISFGNHLLDAFNSNKESINFFN
ncbi:MAG: CvpA family protein [Bacteroidota bacterium]|nr:CvpA family protein [Bacteroidota bacterium]